MIINKKKINTYMFTLRFEHVDCTQYPKVLLNDKLSCKYYKQKFYENFLKTCWKTF